MNKLIIEGLTKRINGNKILDNLSHEFCRGITGIVGLNGSGKSTLLNLLSGLLKADKGNITYNGMDCELCNAAWRSQIGYLSQNQSLYERMTVYAFLDYMLLLSGWNDRKMRKRRISETSCILNFSSFLKKNIASLSGGIKQKISIAHALIHDPPVILLDEPTNNLDNNERDNLHEILNNISRGKIILIVEHILDELPIICNNILILRKGRFIFEGSPETLIENNKMYIREVVIPRDEYFHSNQQNGLLSFRMMNGSVILRIDIRLSDLKLGANVIPKFSEAVRSTYNSFDLSK